MRPTKQPHGKLYKVHSQPGTSLEPASVCLPKGARGHMVVALGWASDRDVVRVATDRIFALETSSAYQVNFWKDYIECRVYSAIY